MPTYEDLKSEKYIDQAIGVVESICGVKFHGFGHRKFSAYCPFHDDGKDSFRAHVNNAGEVRFHCFGECNSDWSVFDVIMKRRGCGFGEAQKLFADYIGLKDFKPYRKYRSSVLAPDQKQEPEATVEFSEPTIFNPVISNALEEATLLYHQLLMENSGARFNPVFRYLEERGVDKPLIDRFEIGFAPPYRDEEYQGRALLDLHLMRLRKNFTEFQTLSQAGVLRLLNDEGFYQQFIDFSARWVPYGVYGDYFAGRITFPIFNSRGCVHGIIGRRPDRRQAGLRWMKQTTEGTVLNAKSWLYGIDKAVRWIRHYQTVILVEGIFDYFAVYRLFQDTNRPIVVSTLGTNLNEETGSLLSKLGVQNYVVAFDWDEAGRKAIEKTADKLDGRIYYLGGMSEGEDPAEKLQALPTQISGFSLSRLISASKRIQKRTVKPVLVSHFSPGTPRESEIILKPSDKIESEKSASPKAPKQFYYETARFLPLLSYDSSNKKALDAKLGQLAGLLEAKQTIPPSGDSFCVPVRFLIQKHHLFLGAALILWLRLAIEQQAGKKRIRATDSTLADWLITTRATVIKYKNQLRELGFLSIDNKHRHQVLSVRYFPR